MHRHALNLLLAVATFTVGLYSPPVWQKASNYLLPKVLMSCALKCQVFSSANRGLLPSIRIESQPNAPVELIFRPEMSDSDVAQSIGVLNFKNRDTKSIRTYSITYQVSGNSWRNESFAYAGLSPSFANPHPGSFILPNESRPVISCYIKVPLNSELTLRIDTVEFEDGTRWQNTGTE
jgi:hypothetical protein